MDLLDKTTARAVAHDAVAESAQQHGPPAAWSTFSSPVALGDVGSSLVVRRAEASDFAKGHLALLAQLTMVGHITAEAYAQRLALMRASSCHVLVVEDLSRGAVVASGSLQVEWKLIHACGAVGHIEDVVVCDTYRGHHLGRHIILALTEVAKAAGCYKCILDCAKGNADFYQKLGFFPSELHMRLDLPSDAPHHHAHTTTTHAAAPAAAAASS